MTVEARIDKEFFSFPESCATVLLSPLILTPPLTILNSKKFNRF